MCKDLGQRHDIVQWVGNLLCIKKANLIPGTQYNHLNLPRAIPEYRTMSKSSPGRSSPKQYHPKYIKYIYNPESTKCFKIYIIMH